MISVKKSGIDRSNENNISLVTNYYFTFKKTSIE